MGIDPEAPMTTEQREEFARRMRKAAPDEMPAPTLEQRVEALEHALLEPLSGSFPEMTPEQAQEWKADFDKAVAGMANPPLLLPAGPRYTPEELRDFLRECVTVVQPGEWLVLRCADITPMQMREYQDMLSQAGPDGTPWLPFRVLVVRADDLATASEQDVRETLASLVRTEIRDALALPADDEPLPDVPWLADCDFETYNRGTMTRVTHRPTGIWKDAPLRAEAIALLAGELIRRGKISINDGRAAIGYPPFTFLDPGLDADAGEPAR